MKVKHESYGHKNRYCGPAALSALAGITAGAGSALLRKVSGKLSNSAYYHLAVP